MTRPRNFEHFRWLGDKRSLVVYDLDADDLDQSLIDELEESEQFASFGPDTLNEARNRNYRLWHGHKGDYTAELAGPTPAS